ncbi:uncharacterized protein LOC100197827 isoform X2 [Hydra vulgaris]|uniref:Uncharacterized protein LOC100197827 isoform X2 n=1 Tax=Hydra vulgaris TaxID=6087 RepID=A0ABM4DK39_HYDVU
MGSDILYYYFCWDDPIQILKILNTFNNIDVFYKNGVFFEYALSNNYVEIFEALVAYFENKQFSIKNEVYDEKKEDLSEILEDFAREMELTCEMKKALSQYIDFDDSSTDSREHDFDNDSDNGFSSAFPLDNEQDNSSTSKYFELTPGNNSLYRDCNKVENWLCI